MNAWHVSRRQWLLWGASAAALPAPVWSQNDGLALLGQFLRQVRSGRALFVQTVTAAGKSGQPARSRQSSGTLEFLRPGRFRFVYRKPYEQTLVADGQQLWLHDVDLNQVTVRPQAQALAKTPLALVTTATDLAQLEKDFALQADGQREGQLWVRATPKAADAPLKGIAIGLRSGERGPELVTLDLQDNLGARTVLQFSQFEAQAVLRAEAFAFVPPPGVDVIRP